MSRWRFLTAVVAGAFACAAPASAASTPPPRDQLRAFVCQKALDPPARALSVQAVMRPMTGTSQMQVKFELMRQLKPRSRFAAVHGRGLGSWISPSDPTLGQRAADVWIVNHPVVNLVAPATYKFRVTFRWIGAQGQTLGTATQVTPTCYQPELRADLLVRSLSVTAISTGPNAGRWTYAAVIANRGLTAAGPVAVEFADGAAAREAATVASVGAKSTARQRFVAAPCTPGTTLTVTVDPEHTNDEYDYANNTLTTVCPAAPTSSTRMPAGTGTRAKRGP